MTTGKCDGCNESFDTIKLTTVMGMTMCQNCVGEYNKLFDQQVKTKTMPEEGQTWYNTGMGHNVNVIGVKNNSVQVLNDISFKHGVRQKYSEYSLQYFMANHELVQ